MFANYNNEKYLYISNRRTKEIVTHIRRMEILIKHQWSRNKK